MNKLIEPKSLLEVRKWKRNASELIRKYGLKETGRRYAKWIHETPSKDKKTSAKH
jgi:hypothetical protein